MTVHQLICDQKKSPLIPINFWPQLHENFKEQKLQMGMVFNQHLLKLGWNNG